MQLMPVKQRQEQPVCPQTKPNTTAESSEASVSVERSVDGERSTARHSDRVQRGSTGSNRNGIQVHNNDRAPRTLSIAPHTNTSKHLESNTHRYKVQCTKSHKLQHQEIARSVANVRPKVSCSCAGVVEYEGARKLIACLKQLEIVIELFRNF